MKTQRTSAVDALLQAHRNLMKDLQDLDRTAGPRSRKGIAALQAGLDQVAAHLTEHFRFEEKNGYMDAVLLREPHRERVIAGLRDEHQALARGLEALRAEAGARKTLDAAFRARVRSWVGEVRAHEARENGLVQDVFNQDIGAED